MSTALAASEPQDLVFVAVAEGARWPSWLDLRRGNPGAVVVAQQAGESAGHFADRVARRAAEFAAGPATFVLAVDERLNELGALTQVAERLGQALAGAPGQTCTSERRLLLTAHQIARGPLRHALMALAGKICSSLPAGTEVGVHFGGLTSEDLESGVFPAASRRSGRHRLLVG